MLTVVLCVKYLELRFNRATRLLGTVLFIVQTVSERTALAGSRMANVPPVVHLSLSAADPLHRDRHLCPGFGFKPRYVVSIILLTFLHQGTYSCTRPTVSSPHPLSAVTGMDLWGAVISTGVVCTFYCTMVRKDALWLTRSC